MSEFNPIDIRIRQLSYSSNCSLHSCPRKYQLYKLQATATDDDNESSVTFAFGHVVGAGIQGVLEGHSREKLIFDAFLGWKPELFADDLKRAKSFWLALSAVLNFKSMHECGYLNDYELVYYKGKPAVELGFLIILPDGFVYRGFVDGVLRHRVTGEVIVLECKTTSSATVHPAQYKNSAQAIGYSIVLDAIFSELSSYKVLYLVYKTKSREFEPMEFSKNYLQRALWLQELILDVEAIKMYEAMGVYPMRGESCYSFFRECEYFETCTLSTSFLTKSLTEEVVEKITKENAAKYPITVTFEELVTSQLEKA